MDSREGAPLTSQARTAIPNMMVGPNSYAAAMPNHNSASNMIRSNSAAAQMASSTSRFPFNSVLPPASKPLESLNASPYDGSQSGLRSGGFNMDAGKKKRGRPRKYSPDGNIALGLSPTPISSSAVQGDSLDSPSSEPSSKKHRGRPPGSGKKQMDALGTGGVGFTPHVIIVNPGEDIASKVLSFSKQGPRTVCILSAYGSICNVTLCQPGSSSGVTYKGNFEIISLSGSVLLSEDNDNQSQTSGLTISLAGSDGRVLGGGVSGMLMAAGPVQVIVGSFIVDGKKPKSSTLKSGSSSAAPQMLNFSASIAGTSPPSQMASSESSDDSGGSTLNRGPNIYNSNSNQPNIHSMQMYQLWAAQTQQ